MINTFKNSKRIAIFTVFVLGGAIALSAQTFHTLVTLSSTNGCEPLYETLVQGTDGRLYGTTSSGGSANSGTVFKTTTGGNNGLTTVVNFTSDEIASDSGLVQGLDGDFYGTTIYGGTNDAGMIFKLTPSGVLTVLHSFSVTDGNGYYPIGQLVQSSSGVLYGTTLKGGADAHVSKCYDNGCGTIFEITPAGEFTLLHSFISSDGGESYAPLTIGSDGNFYGTASTHGEYQVGTVFEMNSSGTLTVLHSFDNTDGSEPMGGLVQGANGNFYGTTYRGGSSGAGTVFEITSSGVFTILHDFAGPGDGAQPDGTLIQGTDGNFYGTTYDNDQGAGNVFEITPSGTLTKLHTFTGGSDGGWPFGGLVQDTNGTFYGTTSRNPHSSACAGTVFSLSTGLGPFVTPRPTAGAVGTKVTILGTNLTDVTAVSFNGTPASFTATGSAIDATVPAGATSGTITVTLSSGALSSNVPFSVTE